MWLSNDKGYSILGIVPHLVVSHLLSIHVVASGNQ